MRQIGTTIAILAALSLCMGCSHEETKFEASADSGKPVFYATICGEDFADCDEDFAGDPGTKTYFDSDLRMHWTAKDSISMFAGGVGNMLYEFTGSTGDREGEFRHLSGDPGTGLRRNYALFPYSSETVLENDGTLIFKIPQTQRYVAGSFYPKSFPMLAVTSDTEDDILLFKNLFGILKLQIIGSDCIKRITLTGNSTSPSFWGTMTMETEGNESLSISSIQYGASSVVLDCGSGVQLDPSTPTSFHIALPPCVLTDGFMVFIEDTDGGFMNKSTDNSVTISRNMLHPMKDFTYVPEPFLGRWYHRNCGVQPYGSFYEFGETPCPSGYRVPTKEEFELLVTYPRRWSISDNPGGVNGMWFGSTTSAVNSATAANPNGCIFFPAVGSLSCDNEGYEHEMSRGIGGNYWSSTPADSGEDWYDNAWGLSFSGAGTAPVNVTYWMSFAYWDSGYRRWYESSVRCIKG